MGDLLTKALAVSFVVIGLVYLYQKDYPRFMYFMCGAGINLSIVYMK